MRFAIPSVPASAAAARALRGCVLAALAAAGTLAAGGAAAQNCANFGDVLASSPFCPSVEWMKNRVITTGCGDGSVYCPNDPVTRLSMAAFMKRLGDALTPVDLAPVAAAGSVVTPGSNPGPVVCATPDYAVTGFPRRAYVNAAVILSAPTAGIDVSATVVYSLNAGGSWTSVNNSDQYGTLYSGASPADRVTLSPFGSVDLAVGQSVRFGVRLGQLAGSGNVTASCHNRVQIANRNGAATPFDVQSATARQRGG